MQIHKLDKGNISVDNHQAVKSETNFLYYLHRSHKLKH